MKTQRALLVTTRPDEIHGLDELNVALSRGWRVACATAMGGAGVGTQDGMPDLCFAALVIIERDEEEAAAELQAREEEEADAERGEDVPAASLSWVPLSSQPEGAPNTLDHLPKSGGVRPC
jgi:hypothetical protein